MRYCGDHEPMDWLSGSETYGLESEKHGDIMEIRVNYPGDIGVKKLGILSQGKSWWVA